MCQAYAGEAASIAAGEAADRARRYEGDGRVARQNGVPRTEWTKLVYAVDFEKPDGEYTTPSWWMNHHFDGPHIKAWLAGWDDEDTLLKAGGQPITPAERARLLDDRRQITWVFSDDVRPYRRRIHGIEMEGYYLSKILKWAGYEDWAKYASGSWRCPAEDMLRYFQEALDAVDAKLHPHHARQVLAFAD